MPIGLACQVVWFLVYVYYDSHCHTLFRQLSVPSPFAATRSSESASKPCCSQHASYSASSLQPGRLAVHINRLLPLTIDSFVIRRSILSSECIIPASRAQMRSSRICKRVYRCVSETLCKSKVYLLTLCT